MDRHDAERRARVAGAGNGHVTPNAARDSGRYESRRQPVTDAPMNEPSMHERRRRRAEARHVRPIAGAGTGGRGHQGHLAPRPDGRSVVIAICAVIWGGNGAWSAAYGLGLVILNFVLAGAIITVTARISFGLMMGGSCSATCCASA